jgi:SAM-dependent methyltransferase
MDLALNPRMAGGVARAGSAAARMGLAESGPYDSYLRAEWRLFAADPAREAAARSAVEGLSVDTVLDIGCGAGQELRPFVRNPGTLGVGVDVSPEAGRAARALFAAEQPDSRVTFVRASAERLPFGDASFDLIICRLALPYTRNADALAEMARLLRPGGVLLLKFHHARYYTLKFREAVAARRPRPALHALRVLGAGLVYHITGSQPRGGLTGGETFQTMWMLRRELGRLGLRVRRPLPDSVPAAPSLLIEQESGSRRWGRQQEARVLQQEHRDQE